MSASICIVGGTFDRPASYREIVKFPPEAVLAEGLAECGFKVSVAGHRSFHSPERYDLVHVNHLGLGALRMATAPGHAKFVYTTHHDARLLDRRRSNEPGFSRSRLMASTFVISRSDHITALSAAEADYLSSIVPAIRDRIQVIYNGIPENVFFFDGDDTRPRDRYRLLFVGKLTEAKGAAILLKALPLIKASRPVQLCLIYQNTSAEAEYRALASELGVADRVLFEGMIPADQLGKVYRSSHMLVLPSFAEGLPSVISEALMCGVPVVASRVGGIPEQVGEFGCLVDPGDPESLASALTFALDRWGNEHAGRRTIADYARDRFSRKKMIGVHAELYRAVLASRSTMRQRSVWMRAENLAVSGFLNTLGNRLSGRGLLER